jgi:ribosome biogenesis protein SSF1/2
MIGQKTEQEKVPKSFVMKTSKVGSSVGQLVQDVRKVMEPHTAIKLKVNFFLFY